MSGRTIEPELMDDPALDAETHGRALAGLARLNRLGGSARIVFDAIADLVDPSDTQPLRILDLATGGGDVPRGLRRRARRRGVPLEVDGCDRSVTALAIARASAADEPEPIRFFELDAVADPLPTGYDVIVTSLFLHHLDTETAVALLGRMGAAARRRIVVNDLDRNGLNVALVGAAARLVTRSRVVRVDGVRSVRAAFTGPELAGVAVRAGLRNARVRRRLPCRLVLTWDRHGDGGDP